MTREKLLRNELVIQASSLTVNFYRYVRTRSKKQQLELIQLLDEVADQAASLLDQIPRVVIGPTRNKPK